MSVKSVVLKLDKINYDGSTQSRVKLNEAVVEEYAHALTEGAALPPVTLFHDGADYWLADGFHRFHAHRRIGAYDIEAEIRSGTRRDAILHSVGANASHGLRRSNDDKRKAVMTILGDAEWAKWSNREIARQCGVSDMLVADVRKEHLQVLADARPLHESQFGEKRVVERGGKTYEQDTANIGKKQKKKPARTIDLAPLPEEQLDSGDELAEAHHTITDLAEENQRLSDRLAVSVMDASEDEKRLAAETIDDLRQQVLTLEAENDALKASRDTYMQKVSEMQRQINYWRKKAEKVAA